ncbi:MAG: DNA-binding protein, partial [Methylocystis sp.]
VVKQRLRLASVSPRLLDIYAEDGMTLDQLMGFTVSSDHERQEQVWEAIQRSYNKEAYQIRRLLTEGAVRASDKRAQYASDDYLAAGGAIMRDLFQNDDGGWLQDARLLDRFVAEKLERDAQAIRAEGWKWVEVATHFPYGHTYGLRHICGERHALTEEESATLDALRAEAEQLEEAHAAADEIPEEVDQRHGEIETAIAAIEERPVSYDPADVARAGAFVSIDGSGRLRIERGYVRPEDEAPIEKTEVAESAEEFDANAASSSSEEAANGAAPNAGAVRSELEESEEDEGLRPLPDKLLTELTAYRTLALREAIGSDPEVAFLAALHVLCLKLFYHYGSDSCLEIEPKTVAFGAQAPGLGDTPLAAKVDARHHDWSEQLPAEPCDLWDALTTFDAETQQRLFAHCVSLTVNAVHEAWNRRPKAIAHADRLAHALSLDLAATGWTPTIDNFVGRVTKARIVEAVHEAKGAEQAKRIEQLKKGDMAREAEQMLAGSGWLPEPLRTLGHASQKSESPNMTSDSDTAIEETAAIESETAIDETVAESDAEDASVDDHQDIAAE